MTQPVEFDRSDAIAILTMRHGKVNAIDVQLSHALNSALDVAHDQGAQTIVLTGTGSCFSAGVDLLRVLEGGPAYVDELLPLLRQTADWHSSTCRS
jgi:enoyl-CoA hydratase